jgi:hypothetical protein
VRNWNPTENCRLTTYHSSLIVPWQHPVIFLDFSTCLFDL